MRNNTLRHKFPLSLTGYSLKKMLSGAVLALLTTPDTGGSTESGQRVDGGRRRERDTTLFWFGQKPRHDFPGA